MGTDKLLRFEATEMLSFQRRVHTNELSQVHFELTINRQALRASHQQRSLVVR